MQQTFKSIPLDRLLIETDSPYLAPVPNRGKKNEPSFVKYTAEKLMKFLVSRGFQADSIHGNKSQGQRDRALQGFKTGTIRVLVATDVAARGIDIPAVEFVFNYDLPNVVENYVHRIGRTARAGASGNAISFCSSVEMKDFIDIERKLNLRIAIASFW